MRQGKLNYRHGTGRLTKREARREARELKVDFDAVYRDLLFLTVDAGNEPKKVRALQTRIQTVKAKVHEILRTVVP